MVVKSSLIWTSHGFVASNYRTTVLVLFCDVVRLRVGFIIFFFGAADVNMVNVI